MSRQFVPSGTMVTCSIASGETTEITATNSTITIYGENWLTTEDNVPNANFKAFPSCSSKCKVPCAIIKGEWETPASDNILSKGKKLLANDSILKCDKGGDISLVMQCVGDMTDPPNTLDKLKEGLNKTFKAVVKKTEAISEGIASTVADIAAPVSNIINNEGIQNVFRVGQGYLQNAQSLKDTFDGYIETAADKTEALSNYLEEEIGGREAVVADLAYDVTDNLQQELDEILNNVEDTINQSLDDIKNGINSIDLTINNELFNNADNTQPNIPLDIVSGINHYEEQLTQNPDTPILTNTGEMTSDEISQQSVVNASPHQSTSINNRIDQRVDKYKDEANARIQEIQNKISSQTQEVRDELSAEVAKLEALIERYSLNNYLQEKIDEELESRIKKAENESKDLQKDIDRSSTLLYGLGSEYDAFVNSLSNELVNKFNSKIDPKLVEAQNKLKTANSNLAMASTPLNGAKFIAGGLPAGLVVTKAKKKKNKGDSQNIGTPLLGFAPESTNSNGNNNQNNNEENITVTMGMFFDGTGNNRFNVDDIDPLEGEDSYSNDHSNVSRAFNYYKGLFNDEEKDGLNIYVEGIGTTSGEEDSLLGFALGIGLTGVEKRVRIGTLEAVKTIFNMVDKYKLKTIDITFDVFGFSRGAAAARHFIHLNSESKKYYDNNLLRPVVSHESFFQYLSNALTPDNPDPKTIKVNITWRFAGLYETVSSHGVNRSNDVGKLGLMNIKHVKHIFHIVASDEYREKFSITPVQAPIIKNGKLSSLKSGTFSGQSIETMVIPGVHSDIGGGYTNDLSEDNMILFISETFNHIEIINQQSQEYLQQEIIANKVKDKFVADGWYKETDNNLDNIKVSLEAVQNNNLNVPATRYNFKVRGSRKKIKNEYSYIPLTIMTEKAIQIGVDFDLKEIKSNFPIRETEGTMESYINSGDFLNQVYKKLKNNSPLNTSELKKLRYKYLHWSSRYDLSIAEPHQPLFSKNDKTKYEREIIPIN